METNIPGRRYRLCNGVLTVPMRNGNIEKAADIIARGNVLTVPMRNGNRNLSRLSSPGMGSYRTYEEWKPGISTALESGSTFLPYL